MPSQSRSREIDHRRNNGCDDNPEELKPVKEGETSELWFLEVVEGRPEQNDKGNEEEEAEPDAALPFRTCTSHRRSPFVVQTTMLTQFM
jgi:hypothetical protein